MCAAHISSEKRRDLKYKFSWEEGFILGFEYRGWRGVLFHKMWEAVTKYNNQHHAEFIRGIL